MHANGIMHRDIKPANILIEPDRNAIVLSDFGLATRFTVSNGGIFGTMVSSDYYRAPELLANAQIKQMKYGPEIDIWSMGCVLAEMLYGRPIILGSDYVSQLKCIDAMDIDFDSRLDLWLDKSSWGWKRRDVKNFRSLLRAMLTIAPGARATARELLNHPFFGNQLPPDIQWRIVDRPIFSNRSASSQWNSLYVWIYERCTQCVLDFATFCRAIQIVSDYLERYKVERKNRKPLAIAAIVIAAKLSPYVMPAANEIDSSVVPAHIVHFETQLLTHLPAESFLGAIVTDFEADDLSLRRYVVTTLLCYGRHVLQSCQCTPLRLQIAAERLVVKPGKQLPAFETELRAILSAERESPIATHFRKYIQIDF